MDREPYLRLTWCDDETDARGYLVVDRLVRGVSSGGLRMRPGCTMDEVADLARTMTRKERLSGLPGGRYRPIGGAKGGIDFDPRDPRAFGVLRRYLKAMAPMLKERWACGEDLGTRQPDIDDAITDIGLRSCVQAVLPLVSDGVEAGMARLAAGFAVDVDGLGLADSAGGYGVAQAALAALAAAGRDPAASTAVVQGFGSMGGATARYLARAGVRVIAVADHDGLVSDPEGLDIEAMLRTRDAIGRIDRPTVPAARTGPREDWVDAAADVAVTAATSYAIDAGNAARVRAAIIVEAANASVVPASETALFERGVVVVPDFVANLAANAWWWWTLFGDVGPAPEDAFAAIDSVIPETVRAILAESRATGVLPRTAAVRRADAHEQNGGAVVAAG